MPRRPDDEADSDDDRRASRKTPVDGIESDPAWQEILRQRREFRLLEERVRELEGFRAALAGTNGAPGSLVRIEHGVDSLRKDFEEDMRTIRTTQESQARKLESHDHIFAKVLIAASTGGAVVGILVNLLFKLLNP